MVSNPSGANGEATELISLHDERDTLHTIHHDHSQHSHSHHHDDGHSHGHHDHQHSHHKHDHSHQHDHDHDHDHGHDHHHHNHHHHDHHHHDHDHDHDHGHAGCDHDHSGWRAYAPHSHSLHTRLQADKSALTTALFILISAFLLQLVGAVIAQSSMLAAESVHSLIDGVTVLLSLISTFIAAYNPTSQYTYGYGRSEILSALLSLIALALLCIKLASRAVLRIWALMHGDAKSIDVNGRIIALAELVTLTANVTMAIVLSRGRSQSLNIRAVRAHVIADSFENLVVLLAGVVIWIFPKAAWIDPVLTIVVVVMLFSLNWRIARETVEVFMQAAPPGRVDALYNRVKKVAGVVRIAQLHVWTVTTGLVIGSARVGVDPAAADGAQMQRVRKRIGKLMREADVTESCVEVFVGEDDNSEDEGDAHAYHIDESSHSEHRDSLEQNGSLHSTSPKTKHRIDRVDRDLESGLLDSEDSG